MSISRSKKTAFLVGGFPSLRAVTHTSVTRPLKSSCEFRLRTAPACSSPETNESMRIDLIKVPFEILILVKSWKKTERTKRVKEIKINKAERK